MFMTIDFAQRTRSMLALGWSHWTLISVLVAVLPSSVFLIEKTKVLSFFFSFTFVFSMRNTELGSTHGNGSPGRLTTSGYYYYGSIIVTCVSKNVFARMFARKPLGALLSIEGKTWMCIILCRTLCTFCVLCWCAHLFYIHAPPSIYYFSLHATYIVANVLRWQINRTSHGLRKHCDS